MTPCSPTEAHQHSGRTFASLVRVEEQAKQAAPEYEGGMFFHNACDFVPDYKRWGNKGKAIPVRGRGGP
jgi:hypothetical protein